MFWTIVAYFVWHSLHARVEANWFAPVYPAFAVAAAVAAHLTRGSARERRLVDFCLRWAAPSGILMFVLLIVQANTGVLTGYRRDATVRSVGVGWRELAPRSRQRASASGPLACWRRITAPPAGLPSIPPGTCVTQQSQRIRWVNMPEPDAAAAQGPAAVCRRGAAVGHPAHLKDMFPRIERDRGAAAPAGPLVIETYALDLLDGAQGDVLDRSPPPELQ